jgi:hypothetical protein
MGTICLVFYLLFWGYEFDADCSKSLSICSEADLIILHHLQSCPRSAGFFLIHTWMLEIRTIYGGNDNMFPIFI